MLVIRRSTGDVLGTHGLQRPGLVLHDVDQPTDQLLARILSFSISFTALARFVRCSYAVHILFVIVAIVAPAAIST